MLSLFSFDCLSFTTFKNPGRQHYRLYTIHKIPTLKILDFQKVKQSERERAQRLVSSAAGAAMEADAKLEARAAALSVSTDLAALSSSVHAHGENETNTFEPGQGKSAKESFVTQFTMDEKSKIREMVANAASAEEIDHIESLVKRGIFPGSSKSLNGSNANLLPPLPPQEVSEENGKRSAEEEKDSSKRQRSE